MKFFLVSLSFELHDVLLGNIIFAYKKIDDVEIITDSMLNVMWHYK